MQSGVVTDAVDGDGCISLVAFNQHGPLGEDAMQARVYSPFDGNPHSVSRTLRVLLGEFEVDELGEFPGEAAKAAAVV
jgi:hypothetical protein